MINLHEIDMVYGKKDNAVHVLRSVSLRVSRGEKVAICGKSGCGKSTLLNILGGVSHPNDGQYRFQDLDVLSMKQKELAGFRNQQIGFVVQHFALIPDLSVAKNIELPLLYRRCSKAERDMKVKRALERVGISDLVHRLPTELSGGQKQRVAIARAIVGQPAVLLADEPTGALDEQTGSEVLDLLLELNKQGMTIIMVTHDRDIAKRCQRIVNMRDGLIEPIS